MNAPITSASAPPATPGRGRGIAPQGVGGYDQNWYPICLAGEIGDREILAVPFMNGKVIAFRDPEGKPAVLSAFCRHLGASLEDGRLINGRVRCPFHHWNYDATGLCVGTALGEQVPDNTRLVRFPVAESVGLVWAFNGEEPLYDVPSFGPEVDEAGLEFMSEVAVELPVDPFVPFSNTTDIQHLRAVHGIKLEIDPKGVDHAPHGLAYTQDMTIPNMGQMTQNVRLFGTNALHLYFLSFGKPLHLMAAGRPTPGNRTQTYNVAASPRGTEAAGDIEMVRAVVEQTLAFGRQLAAEDEPILRNISFRRDTMTAADALLGSYLDYVERYPRSAFACDMIA